MSTSRLPLLQAISRAYSSTFVNLERILNLVALVNHFGLVNYFAKNIKEDVFNLVDHCRNGRHYSCYVKDVMVINVLKYIAANTNSKIQFCGIN